MIEGAPVLKKKIVGQRAPSSFRNDSRLPTSISFIYDVGIVQQLHHYRYLTRSSLLESHACYSKIRAIPRTRAPILQIFRFSLLISSSSFLTGWTLMKNLILKTVNRERCPQFFTCLYECCGHLDY